MIALTRNIKITGFGYSRINCDNCPIGGTFSTARCLDQMSDIIYNRYSSQFPEYFI